MKEKITILGTYYKITTDKVLDDADGRTDQAEKEIKLCSKMLAESKKRYINEVIRHELYHAILIELGKWYDYGIHTEENVNLLAITYPKIKAIFEALEVEE